MNWDRFDRVVVLALADYVKDRMPRLEKELDRVGLLPRTEFHWNVKNPFTHRFMVSMYRCRGMTRPEVFSVLMGHYEILKESVSIGCGSVLVLEDDVMFLRDEGLLQKMVDDLPGDSDRANFEWTMRPDSIEKLERDGVCKSGVPGWYPLQDDYNLCGTACIAWSRSGAQRFIDIVEKAADGTVHDNMLRPANLYFGWNTGFVTGLHAYLSNPVLAVQRTDTCERVSRACPCVDYCKDKSRDSYGTETP